MFADAGDIQAELVGERNLLDEVAEALARADPASGLWVGP
jgi:hypothetical protein